MRSICQRRTPRRYAACSLPTLSTHAERHGVPALGGRLVTGSAPLTFVRGRRVRGSRSASAAASRPPSSRGTRTRTPDTPLHKDAPRARSAAHEPKLFFTTPGCDGRQLVMLPVGAGNRVTSCDVDMFADQSAEPIAPQDAHAGHFYGWAGAPGGRVLLQRP